MARRAVLEHEDWWRPVLFSHLANGRIWPRSTGTSIPEPLSSETCCPYPGLRPFEAKESDRFFGRDDEIATVARLLEQKHPLITITGASGTGKSSLVQAGIIPRIQHQYQQQALAFTLSLRTGADTLEELAELLGTQEAAAAEPAELAASLRSSNTALLEALNRAIILQEGRHLVLVLDQFEELFVPGNDAADENRRRLLANLFMLAEKAPPAITVLITSRRNFQDHPEYDAKLSALLEGENEIRLFPLNRNSLRTAIEEPLQSFNREHGEKLEFEPELVNQIVYEFEQTSLPLPIVQYLLYLLWTNKRSLTSSAYQDLGTLKKVLDRHADAVYESLDANYQNIARRVLLDLVRPGLPGNEEQQREYLRKRVAREYLFRSDDDRHAVEYVLGRLSRQGANLINEQTWRGTTSCELVHQVILAQWGRLRAWIDSEQQRIEDREHLLAAARPWLDSRQKRRGGDPGSLYNRSNFNRARTYIERERKGYDSSVDQRIADCFEATRRHRRRNTILSASAIVVVIIALAVMAVLLRERSAAEARQQRISRSVQLAGQAQELRETNPQRSVLLAIEALHISRRMGEPYPPEAEQALRDALQSIGGRGVVQTEGELTQAMMSPDQRWLLTGSEESFPLLWPLESGNGLSGPLEIETSSTGLPAATFSADGSYAALGIGRDGEIQVVDLTGEDPAASSRFLDGHTETISVLAFSSDGRWLASGDESGEIRLWDLQAPDPSASASVLEGHSMSVAALGFSPDGRWLASSGIWGDNTTLVFDLADGEPGRPVRLEQQSLTGNLPGNMPWDRNPRAAIFSPDGRWLATAAVSRNPIGETPVFLWDLNAAAPFAEPVELPGHRGGASLIMFGPQGRYLVTGDSLSDAAFLWDIVTLDAEAHVLSGLSGGATAAFFSDNGRWLLTSSFDEGAILWDLTADEPAVYPLRLRAHSGAVTYAAFSANGQRLATVSGDLLSQDTSVQLWDLTAADPTVSNIALNGHDSRVSWVGFAGDGMRLFSAGIDGTVRVWDVLAPDTAAANANDTDVAGTIYPLIVGPPDADYNTTVFSPDGRWLATADNKLQLWDLAAADPMAAPLLLGGGPDSDDYFEALAFSNNGKLLAGGGWNGTLRLWELDNTTIEAPRELHGPTDNIAALAFSPQETWLAAIAEDDSQIWLWQLNGDPDAQPIVLESAGSPVNHLTFSHDGRWLATAAGEALEENSSTVQLWDLATANPAANGRLVSQILAGHIMFSSDDRWLLSSTHGSTALTTAAALSRLDTANPATETQQLMPAENQQDVIWSAISPDGRYALVAGYGTIRLYDLQANDPLAQPLQLLEDLDFNLSPMPQTISFSPDGMWLAAGSGWGGEVWLWRLNEDAASGAPLVLRGHRGEQQITAVAFSADSRLLASAGEDGRVMLWDLNAANPTADSIMLHDAGAVEQLKFSPDGRWLMTRAGLGVELLQSGISEQTLRLWPLSIDELITTGCQAAGRNLSQDEWQQYFGSEPYRATCPTDAVANLAEPDQSSSTAAPPTATRPAQPLIASAVPSATPRPDAETLIQRGLDLAYEGDRAAAAEQFELALAALALDPEHSFDPNSETTRIIASVLIEQGLLLAEQGDIDGAVVRLENARQMIPDLEIDPEADARRARALALVREARGFLMRGDMATGMARYEEAQQLDESLSDFLAVERDQLVPFIGISFLEVDSVMAVEQDLPVSSGILVIETIPGSPADEAGLETGDIITAVGDQALQPGVTLNEIIRPDYDPGDTVTLTVLRMDSEQEMELIIGAVREVVYAGIEYHTITPEVAAQASLPATSGELITAVVPDGPAARAGLQRNDIILQIDGTALTINTRLQPLLWQNYQPGDEVELTILRDGEQRSLSLQLGSVLLQGENP
jgi:WD40 repeat protein